jgi:hypothetical protein
MMDFGTRLTSLPRTPVREMMMKIQPSMNTAASASWYVICVCGECVVRGEQANRGSIRSADCT